MFWLPDDEYEIESAHQMIQLRGSSVLCIERGMIYICEIIWCITSWINLLEDFNRFTLSIHSEYWCSFSHSGMMQICHGFTTFSHSQSHQHIVDSLTTYFPWPSSSFLQMSVPLVGNIHNFTLTFLDLISSRKCNYALMGLLGALSNVCGISRASHILTEMPVSCWFPRAGRLFVNKRDSDYWKAQSIVRSHHNNQYTSLFFSSGSMYVSPKHWCLTLQAQTLLFILHATKPRLASVLPSKRFLQFKFVTRISFCPT